jgi:polysaccharide export outer membrane protein
MMSVKKLMVMAALAACCCLPAAGAAQEYVIGGGDLLKITVYDNPDLTTETRVSNDGKITFPLIGEVQANGSTAIELEKKIAHLLEDGYIVKPQVSVFIEEYKSKKVSVLGEVAKPGLVVLRGAYSLMEAISDAGGITPNAGDILVIQRKISRGSGKSDAAEKEDVSITVDMRKLFEEGDVTANVPVVDGDSIYVPKAAFVYVYGEVKNPGAYKITTGLTVLKSITLAGGFTPKSSEGRTKIIRKTEKGETTVKAKMDEVVLPDDIVFVPESIF